MDSLGPAVSKLQGKTERRLSPHLPDRSPSPHPGTPVSSSPPPFRLPRILSSPDPTLRRVSVRGARTSHGASNTLGPAMIHLRRGYCTARYTLCTLRRPSLPSPPPPPPPCPPRSFSLSVSSLLFFFRLPLHARFVRLLLRLLLLHLLPWCISANASSWRVRAVIRKKDVLLRHEGSH